MDIEEVRNLPTRDYESLPVKAVSPDMMPDSKKYSELKDSIAKHGIKEPIQVHEATEEEGPWLYEGHHRAVIASELNLPKVPVKYINNQSKPY